MDGVFGPNPIVGSFHTLENGVDQRLRGGQWLRHDRAPASC